MSRLLKLGEKHKMVTFGIVLAAAIGVNIVLQPIGLRLDLSRNQAYTLSESSKRILRNVDNKAKITFFVSKDIPTRLVPVRREVTDLLNEFQRAGGGKVTVEVRDPKTDSKAKELAEKNGITEVRFSQLEQDKFNVSNGYFGLLISFNQQDKAIPQLFDLDNLEYNITSSIYMLARKDTPKVGIIGRDPVLTMQQQDPLGALKELLRQQFTVEDITLSATTPPVEEGQPTPEPQGVPAIDTSYKALLIFDTPPKKYSTEDLNKIREYLNKKGKAVVFMNGIQVEEQLVATQEATSNLFGLTQEYGIKVNKDFALSTDAELINFGSGVSQFYLPYPYWLKASNFNSESGYFSSITTVTMPWVSSLTLENKPGYTVTSLIKTNERAWVYKDKADLDPQKAVNNIPSALSQYSIAATSKNKKGGELMVIPSSRFALSSYFPQQAGNLNFLVNVVNNYASDGALSGIRARAVDIYPLPALSDSEKNLFKYGNMLALPLLFAAFGAYYIWKRT